MNLTQYDFYYDIWAHVVTYRDSGRDVGLEAESRIKIQEFLQKYVKENFLSEGEAYLTQEFLFNFEPLTNEFDPISFLLDRKILFLPGNEIIQTEFEHN